MKILPLCSWSGAVELGIYLKNQYGSLLNGCEFLAEAQVAQADVVLIINFPATLPRLPENTLKQTAKVVVVTMEPRIAITARRAYGPWVDPNLAGKTVQGWPVALHSTFPAKLNLIEMHLGRICNEAIPKTHGKGILSTVVSNKHNDYGHALRVAVVKWLDTYHSDKITVHVYGPPENTFHFRHHKGNTCIPLRDKSNAITPYKYHLAFENNAIYNYVTEKLYDGLFCDAHVLYWGAPNTPEVLGDTGTQAITFLGSVTPGSVADLAEKIVRVVCKEDPWEKSTKAREAARTHILNTRASQVQQIVYLS